MNLSPTQKDIDYWVETFLPAKDIYYLDGSYTPSRLEGTELLPVKDLLAHLEYGNMAYTNAYEYWRMDPARVKQVLVASPDWFAALPMPERATLFRQQVQLERGLVFGLDVLHGQAFKKMIQHAGIDGKLVLNHYLWNRLELNFKQQTTERVAKHWESFECEPCPEEVPVWVKTRANSFVHFEGTNGFGAALFGASGDEAWLTKWVWQEEFLANLGSLGFQEAGHSEPIPGDVTIFYDGSGREAHACYQLSNGLVLNKSGQSKYQALKVIRYDQVLEDWKKFNPRHFASTRQ
ncbi:MAG TPA: hypothetical protein VLR89_05450 [Anaerolineaceae bacterium]|nr:hypothetical protein [Anaerolineaceae bacterium]